MNRIPVAMIDDHHLFLEACSALVSSDKRFEIVVASDNSTDFYEKVRKCQPRIALIDINMEPVNGFDIAREAMRLSPGMKAIGLSVSLQPAYAKKMLYIGGKGYLTKNSGKEELLDAIWKVYEGEKYICREIMDMMANEAVKSRKLALTRKEIDVAGAIRKGLSSREIGALLAISQKTVEVHRCNILRKLGLKNTAALVNYINLRGI